MLGFLFVVFTAFVSVNTFADTDKKSQYTTTDSGLRYRIFKEGTGPKPEKGDKVKVHYTGKLTDGTVFDSSKGRGPFEFKVGTGQVIRGWDEGVVDMKVGEVRELVIPPNLGYGSRGAGNLIPPDSTLVFEVEMLEIVK
jgi:peptidylprolyl isomerase